MSKPYKVWYQSFVDPNEQKSYIKKLQSYISRYADDGFIFEVHGISPPDKNLHPLTEFRCAAQTIINAIEAEKQGYDAFVIGHFQEPGINEIKASINIPVIGLGESTMLTASSMGRKIGLVTINPIFIPWHENQIVHYGLQQRFVGVKAVNAQVEDLNQAFSDQTVYQRLLIDFKNQLQPLLDLGAEVIIPAGGLPMLLFADEKELMIEQAIVLNGIAVVTKYAEMLIKLKALTGVSISHRSTYSKANEETLNEFLAFINHNPSP